MMEQIVVFIENIDDIQNSDHNWTKLFQKALFDATNQIDTNCQLKWTRNYSSESFRQAHINVFYIPKNISVAEISFILDQTHGLANRYPERKIWIYFSDYITCRRQLMEACKGNNMMDLIESTKNITLISSMEMVTDEILKMKDSEEK